MKKITLFMFVVFLIIVGPSVYALEYCNGKLYECPSGKECICCADGYYGTDCIADSVLTCKSGGGAYCKLEVTGFGKGFKDICTGEQLTVFGVLAEASGGPDLKSQLSSFSSRCTRSLNPTTYFDVSSIAPLDIGIYYEATAAIFTRTLLPGTYNLVVEYHRASDNFRIVRWSYTGTYSGITYWSHLSAVGYVPCEISKDGFYYVTWDITGPVSISDRVDFYISGIGDPLLPITLTVRPPEVAPNEEIEIIVSACGDTGKGYDVGRQSLHYSRSGAWVDPCICTPGYSNSCSMTSVTNCQNNWIVSEPTSGTYSYWGYFYDKEGVGHWTVPWQVSMDVTAACSCSSGWSCVGDTAVLYSGSCVAGTSECEITFDIDCNANNGWYCNGDTAELRDYTCTGAGSCSSYSLSLDVDCNANNGWYSSGLCTEEYRDYTCTGAGSCSTYTVTSTRNKADGTSCGLGKECSGGSCVAACTPSASYSCYSNDVYYYDSCGNLGDKKEECNDGYWWKTPAEYQCDSTGDVDRRAVAKSCGTNTCLSSDYWSYWDTCAANEKCNAETGTCDPAITCSCPAVCDQGMDDGVTVSCGLWGNTCGATEACCRKSFAFDSCVSSSDICWDCGGGPGYSGIVSSFDDIPLDCSPYSGTPTAKYVCGGSLPSLFCEYDNGADLACDGKLPGSYEKVSETRLDWCTPDCNYDYTLCNEFTECTSDPERFGEDIWCYYSDGTYHWGSSLSIPLTETDCNDGHDNDCDGYTDRDEPWPDTDCGECTSDPDCDPKDNKLGKCDLETNICKWPACRGNEHCIDGSCCDKLVGGTGNCVGLGIWSSNPAWLCTS